MSIKASDNDKILHSYFWLDLLCIYYLSVDDQSEIKKEESPSPIEKQMQTQAPMHLYLLLIPWPLA
jgi:hypothetical protein